MDDWITPPKAAYRPKKEAEKDDLPTSSSTPARVNASGGFPPFSVLWAQTCNHPAKVFENALTIRLWFPPLLIALIPGGLGTLISPVFSAILFWGVFLPLWFALAADPKTVTRVWRCPDCKKRVKPGADTCHHCGRKVSNVHWPRQTD